MTTSFDTPRVLGHHNPFASFEDTTDDPLASGSGGGGGSGFPSYTSTSHGINSNTSTSTDPWSNSYYVPVGEASTSSSTSNNNAQLNGILDEDSIPVIYIQAWNAASSSSSNSSTSFGSTFNTTGNTISLTILQKVLSNCAALSAGDTEKVSSRCPSYLAYFELNSRGIPPKTDTLSIKCSLTRSI